MTTMTTEPDLLPLLAKQAYDADAVQSVQRLYYITEGDTSPYARIIRECLPGLASLLVLIEQGGDRTERERAAVAAELVDPAGTVARRAALAQAIAERRAG